MLYGCYLKRPGAQAVKPKLSVYGNDVRTGNCVFNRRTQSKFTRTPEAASHSHSVRLCCHQMLHFRPNKHIVALPSKGRLNAQCTYHLPHCPQDVYAVVMAGKWRPYARLHQHGQPPPLSGTAGSWSLRIKHSQMCALSRSWDPPGNTLLPASAHRWHVDAR